MFKSTTFTSSEQKVKSWVPSLFGLSAIVPIIGISFLAKQPKEVTVTIYSAYLAVLAVSLAVVSKKNGKRRLATIAFTACIVFTAMFTVYAYLAFKQ